MQVDAITATAASAAEPVAPTGTARVEVTLERTAVTRDAMRSALGTALETYLGHPPSTATLDVVTAHASLETGAGRSMYNFNFGGIKGAGPGGLTASARTHEWAGGVRYETHAQFRAYDSLDAGAHDFVSLLQRRYPDALDAASRGDPDGYASALARRGYFTGPELRYANDLRGLLGMPSRAAPPPDLAAVDASTFSSTSAVSRILDAVSVSAARIAAPERDAG